jgi:hypothetical protein
MILYFFGREFEFVPDNSTSFRGHLVLDAAKKELLLDLVESQDETWCLNSHGERLPEELLFERSPWSLNAPERNMKILNRWLDLETGEVIFSTPETYGGESFSWVRHEEK